MSRHPWHPRLVPFALYLCFLPLIQGVQEQAPQAYPLVYALQSGLVVWLLWRYRKLVPELTLSFHWLSVPVGAAVAVAWIVLGWMMADELGLRWEELGNGKFLPQIDYVELGREPGRLAVTEPHELMTLAERSSTVAWTSLILRLLGMAIVVPMFEELFIRSLMLRSLHRLRQTGIGLVQLLHDLPVVGEWIIHTSVGERAAVQPPAFSRQFQQTPLGALSIFGVSASTLVFMAHHVQRDWPGCIVCGIAYCLLLGATRRKGLGPVIWAHGITNALLWIYTLTTCDWQFL